MPYLLVTSGPSAGNSFNLNICPVSVGREVTQDVQLMDLEVSRKHFVVQRRGSKYTAVAQPNAKNGMMVNEKTVPEAELADGDRIRVGDTELVFVASDDPAAIDAMKRARVWSKQSVAQTVKSPLKK